MLDQGFKVLVLLIGVVLVAILWRGVPVQLQVIGPMSSSGGIPISVFTAGDAQRYEMQAATDGTGTVVITRLDKMSGTIEVFELERIGRKLNPIVKRNLGEQ